MNSGDTSEPQHSLPAPKFTSSPLQNAFPHPQSSRGSPCLGITPKVHTRVLCERLRPEALRWTPHQEPVKASCQPPPRCHGGASVGQTVPAQREKQAPSKSKRSGGDRSKPTTWPPGVWTPALWLCGSGPPSGTHGLASHARSAPSQRLHGAPAALGPPSPLSSSWSPHSCSVSSWLGSAAVASLC